MALSPRPRLVLVRHGETAWSRSGQHTGLTDLPLLPEGELMARKLAEALGAWRFAAVWTSPLRRAADTCRLAGYGDQAQVREALREWDYGDYEGRTAQEIRAARPDWSLWFDGVPGGETAEQVAMRADSLIAEVLTLKGDVAVFSHGHLLRVLAARWVGLPPEAGRLFALSTGSISVLGWDSLAEQRLVGCWNDTTHLRARTGEPPGID